jgi:hypothetical protein
MITKQVINLHIGKQILLEVLDARSIMLTTDSLLITQYPINSLKPLRINVASEIYVDTSNAFHKFIFPITKDRNMSYEIRIIKRIDVGKYLLLTHERTVCSYFLPAMLSDSTTKANAYDRDWFGWTNYFMNAYFVMLPEEERPNGSKYCIGLLYRFIPVEGFIEFEHRIKSHPMYLMNYEMDVDTTLMLFRVPKEYYKDENILFASKYSELSDKLKSKVLTFGKFAKDGDMAKILCKDPRLKRQLELDLRAEIGDNVELLERIDAVKETIIINNYAKSKDS